MSCNICGEDNKLYYCEYGDCDICEECFEDAILNFNCEECEYFDNCNVMKAKEEQEIELKFKTKKNNIYKIVNTFFKDNNITCVDTIYQSDRVIENVYDFLENLYNAIND